MDTSPKLKQTNKVSVHVISAFTTKLIYCDFFRYLKIFKRNVLYLALIDLIFNSSMEVLKSENEYLKKKIAFLEKVISQKNEKINRINKLQSKEREVV